MLVVRCPLREEQVEAAEGWEEYELCPGFEMVCLFGCKVRMMYQLAFAASLHFPCNYRGGSNSISIAVSEHS